jgi:hypothetical protein
MAATSLARARRSAAEQRPSRERHQFERPPGNAKGVPQPDEVPARGWLEILQGLWHSFTKDRVLALAAGVTFYAILAIFPAIAALVSLYGLFADPKTIASQLDLMSGVLPGGGLDVLRDELTRVASSGNRSLGFAFLGGLAVALWSANAGMKALFETLNLVVQGGGKARHNQTERDFIGVHSGNYRFCASRASARSLLFRSFSISSVWAD